MDLLAELHKNPFVLAPMAGITDKPFRTFMRHMNCGAVITELVSANGFKYNSEKTLKLMQFDDSQHPIGVQIFGEHMDALSETAKYIEGMGADFVDLNLGCPVPKVVKKGAGSALLKDLPQLTKVLRLLKSSVSIPVTIKIRTGWTEESRNADQVTQIAFDEGITWVGIHGRSRSQGYSGVADWDYIRWVKENSKVPVLGNGDITNSDLAVQRLEQSKCDGVMIGRGCLKNPWIFRESLEKYSKMNFDVERNFKKLFSDLYGEMSEFHPERVAGLQVKKYAGWFSAGYPGSSKFRKQLFQIKENSELMSYIDEFFTRLQREKQLDTSHESFLMGGHG